MKDTFSSYPQARFPGFAQKVSQVMPSLPNLEARVAQYMMLNIGDMSFETGASLAKKVGASEVTVSRLLRRLGYQGMRGLKRELKAELSAQFLLGGNGQARSSDAAPFHSVLDLEIQGLVGVFRQCAGPAWHRLVRTVHSSERVYVTGFQTVRGLAEDCARRLALARDDVRFVSAHDGMLAEWIGRSDGGPQAKRECLLLIDVVPYAREAAVLGEFCQISGRQLVIFTDEFCHWAQDFTDLVIHARSRSGLFLESTVGIAAALNLLVHEVAEQNPSATKQRLEHWQAAARKLNVF
jgi:DNA-binding MurR/RpiR family transcriptional regulator